MNEAFFTPIEDCMKVSSTFGQDFAARRKLLHLEDNLVPPRFPGLPRSLLKFSGGSVHDYATIFGESPSPS